MATKPEYTYAAKLLRVIDGDTIVVNVDLGMRISTEITVRLMGINAPELNTEAGKNARAFVRTLNAEQVVVKTHKDPKDKYGRWLGEVFINGESLNELMIAKGHAVRMK